jgi:hypothetical protein
MWGKRRFSGITRSLSSLGFVVGIAAAGTARASIYPGNGATGFGGPVGIGSLTVTDDGAGNIDFSLQAGVPFSGNDLVVYLDTQPGGVADNATFTDNGDPGRTAISGANNGNPSRSLVSFAPGFLADKAISLEPGVFAGLFDLSTPSNFGFIASGNLAGSGSGPFTFSYSRAQLGLGPTDSFSFEGTLISTTAYRSNETIGASVTVPGTLGDTPNAGFNGSTTFLDEYTFAAPVPLPPVAWAGLVLIGVVVATKTRRRIFLA